MTDYLMLTLYAPMAAMGEVAVGERRASWEAPAKSAILGLVAAALGIEREDDEAHLAMNEGYGYGVLINEPGRPLEDYHTAQTASQAEVRKLTKSKGHAPYTRRDLLQAEKLETILSSRGYRTDVLYTAALWAKDQAPYPLERILNAIKEPHYTPYFGRKSCPFALPLYPRIETSSDTLDGAFRAHIQNEQMQDLYSLLHGFSVILKQQKYLADSDAFLDGEHDYYTNRRDQVLSRKRWQFLPRNEKAGYLRDVKDE